jgi:hypothetical protein
MMMMPVLAGSLILSSSALAAIEVLFCQVDGHAKALVPAGADVPAGTEFKVQIGSGFDRPFPSPDGTKFFFTGLADLATTEDECYIVVDGSSASTVAREGTAFGSPTSDLLALGDQRMGINNAGHFVFGADTNAATTADKFVIKWDGTNFVTVAREGDFIPGSTTETWGNGMNSGHILADGTPAFCAVDTGGMNPTTSDDYCMVGTTILIQTSNPIEAANWDAFNSSDFWVTPDNAHWLMIGDDTTATTQDRILAVDGVVRAREGVPLIGSTYTANVSASFGGTESVLANDGSYMLRGHNVDAEDWVLRNGAVIASTDDPITASSTEIFTDDAGFTDCFFTIASNAVGDYIVGGVTDATDVNANAVMVLNGETVIARENDMVDLNGNGKADDDAFIAVFNNDDCFLTDDLRLVFFADVRNAALTSLGQMVLSMDLKQQPKPCPGDADTDGDVDADDLTSVILQWGNTCPCTADVDDDNDVDADDLVLVVLNWGDCP